MEIIIEAEKESEYAEIEAVLRGAFWRDGADEEFNEWVLVSKIRQCGGYLPELSLVAKDWEKIVGYIMFNLCTIGGKDSLALAPLGVLPAYQQKGIGSLLVQEGLKRAKQLGYGSSIVLGSPYYTRFGYLPVPPGIHLSKELDPHLYYISLNQQQGPHLEGQVVYCAPFYDKDGNLL